MGVLDFLRDVGKHVTVNYMLAKESVRSRVASEHGISFTEFSYMLLQANDYAWLHEHMNCELQAGGSDQWGNITAGIDLVRRRSGASVHGLTVPLVTRSDGEKFGKSVDGALWLDPERTSPYALYQYFVNLPDDDVERYLLQLTLVPVDEARRVAAEHARAPERRAGQQRLAWEMTALIHGPDGGGRGGGGVDRVHERRGLALGRATRGAHATRSRRRTPSSTAARSSTSWSRASSRPARARRAA